MKHSVKTIIFIVGLLMLLYIPQGGNAYAAMKYDCQQGQHRYSVAIIEQPTEDKNGRRKYTCDLCGKTYETDIPKTGHSWGKWVVDRDATCEQQGKKHRVCKNNKSHIQNKVIPKTEHKYVKTITEKPTCTKKGSVTYKCSVCGNTYKKSIPATGHNWGEWIVDKKAGITAKGQEHRVCQNDKTHIEKREIKGSIKNADAVDVAVTTTGFSLFWIFAVFIFSDIMILVWYKRKKKKQLNDMKNNKDK